jgi:MoaA/NifB/PqqE/SkfB family radical SAM enzyme
MRNIKTIINHYRSMFNLFQIFGTRSPFPLVVLAHLTTACGCDCSMCYQKTDPLFSELSPKQMSVELFEKLLSQAGRFARKPLIHLYGGEPLRHPDFGQIIRLLDQGRLSASMNTNGELLEKYAELLVAGPVRMINVSLDGPPDIHDSIRRRPGLFDHAVRGMKALRRLDDKIQINVNFVVGKLNAPNLFDNLVLIERAFGEMRLNHMSIEHLAFTQGMIEVAADIDAIALKAELERISNHRFAFGVSATPVIRPSDLEKYYRTFLPIGRTNCNVPWIALYILPDGRVTPGGGMFACTKVVGSMRSESLRQIWNGKTLRAFRRGIKNAMPADCARCCHTIHYSPIIRCTPSK